MLRFMVLLRSPGCGVAIENTTVWMPAQLIVLDDADLILDAGAGKLYPLIPGNNGVVSFSSELKRTS